ncbi:MAG: hypothetical protein R2750_14550, partial [Bacteroidales bacterium]
MKNYSLVIFIAFFLLLGCENPAEKENKNVEVVNKNYFDNSGRDDILSGGVKMIPIQTPSGEFKVWTKRVGNNPR